jgi:flagellar FliL protein
MAEAAAEETKPTVPVTPGIPLKLVLLIGVGTLALGVGGTFGLMKMTSGGHRSETHKEEPAAAKTESHGESTKAGAAPANTPGAIFDLEPFIVNLADTPEIRYLKVTVKLELDKADVATELTNRLPPIRDAVLVLLTGKDSATLRTPHGKFQLREEMTQRINALLPRPVVRSAYFTEFVIQ